jgi:hypothetical protein
MAELSKEVIKNLFERAYNKMNTDVGRNVALGIYYLFKAAIVIVSISNGISIAQYFLP